MCKSVIPTSTPLARTRPPYAPHVSRFTFHVSHVRANSPRLTLDGATPALGVAYQYHLAVHQHGALGLAEPAQARHARDGEDADYAYQDLYRGHHEPTPPSVGILGG